MPDVVTSIEENNVLTANIVFAGWKLTSRSNINELLTFHLYVSHTETSKHSLHARLWETSDPNHVDYGKHMSFNALNTLMTPSKKSRHNLSAPSDDPDAIKSVDDKDAVAVIHLPLCASRTLYIGFFLLADHKDKDPLSEPETYPTK